MRTLATRLLVALLAGVAAACAGEDPRPGRIVLVSMDTVRADYVQGPQAAPIAPNLARIASQGVAFDRFYAASGYTLPSHMSIFTGLDPAEHGVLVMSARLGPEVPTLAEILAAEGYRTWGFHEGGFVAGGFGFDRGFERYRELPRVALVEEERPRLRRLLEEAPDEPYFLFVHTYAAHGPYGGHARYRSEHPDHGLLSDAQIAALRARYPAKLRRRGRAPAHVPEPTRRACTLYNQFAPRGGALLGCGDNQFAPDFPQDPRFPEVLDQVRRSYAERVGRVDAMVGVIREVLEERGQWQDTLLVVTSDHGEAFFEHGLYKHEYVPFDEVLRVPLIVSFPARLGTPGRVVDELAWHVDLLPTITSLAGIPSEARPYARDLTPQLLGRSGSPEERAVFPTLTRPAQFDPELLRRVALRGALKYIEGHPEFGDAEGLLFDLESDAGEERNLRADAPDSFEGLAETARKHARGLRLRPPVHRRTGKRLDLDAVIPTDLRQLPPERREQLRVLGYVD